jgi:hypothetical protein
MERTLTAVTDLWDTLQTAPSSLPELAEASGMVSAAASALEAYPWIRVVRSAIYASLEPVAAARAATLWALLGLFDIALCASSRV